MASRLWRAGFLALLLILVGSSVRGQNTVTVPSKLVAYPDLIVYNAKIVSMDDYSTNNALGHSYQAMAVHQDRIQFMGTNDEILSLAGPQTRKIDVKGRTVIPGMINTHTHLHNGFVSDWGNDPKNAEKVEKYRKKFAIAGKSFGEINKGIELVVKEQMAHPLPGQWAFINLRNDDVGSQWIVKAGDQNKGGVNNVQGMSREELDKLAPKLPVVVTSFAGSFFTNTAARNDLMQYYDVEPTDENEATAVTIGTTFERALLEDRYFDGHSEELKDVLEAGYRNVAAAGFTTYSSHIVGLRFQPVMREMSAQGRMPIRFGWGHRGCQLVEPDEAGCFLRLGDIMSQGNPYFWNIGMTVGAVDMVVPSICTSIEKPADPNVKKQEICYLEPGGLYRNAVYTALRNRSRYVVNHANGDRALDYVMDIMEQVMKDNPDITLDFMRSLRVSADHCAFYPQIRQLPRMHNLGMMFSCGAPRYDTNDRRLKLYGEQYANQVSPIHSMLANGIRVGAETEGITYRNAEGSTPMALFYPFITRQRDTKSPVMAPEERIDRESLMKMTTIWAAHFVLREKELGSLEPGKFADFLVLNKDYFTIPQDQIPTVYPLMTVVGGKIEVLRQEFATEIKMPPVGPQLKFSFEAGDTFGGGI